MASVKSAQVSGNKWTVLILSLWAILFAVNQLYELVDHAAPSTRLAVTDAVVTEKGVTFDGIVTGLSDTCELDRIEWVRGNRGHGSELLEIKAGGVAVSPDNNALILDGWRLNVGTLGAFYYGTFANVYASCRVGPLKLPWLTKSRLWR